MNGKLIWGVSNMQDGNMSENWGRFEEVEENRIKFVNKLGINWKDVVLGSLLSGAEINEVKKHDKGVYFEGDGLITRAAGLGLWMVVGDCFPVIMYEPEMKILALVHLGYKGIDLKLAEKMIAKMAEAGGNVDNIQVWIGPGARKDSYIWEPDEVVQRRMPDWQEFLETRQGRMHVDLAGYLKKQLVISGIKKTNIEDSGIDTISDKRYFSHYRSKRTGEPEGRFGVVVMMKE